jgi:hypothetical protein
MNDSQDVLERACAIARIDAAGVRLLRAGSNAVYRLKAPIIARVSRPGADAGHVRRLSPGGRNRPATGRARGECRSGSALEDLHLPELAPFASAPQRIEASTWLSPQDRAFLPSMLAQTQTAYARLEFALPPGVIHGDANVGNVQVDHHGNPVVIDLDEFATGPRKWDLALTALYYDSFGWYTRKDTKTSCACTALTSWPGPVMRAVREFLMVTWVIQKPAESGQAAAEATKRIAALRTGANRKDRQPH